MIREEDITVEINMVGDNKMTVRCAPVSDSYLYAFQLFCNGKMVDRVLYSEEKETLFLAQSDRRICCKSMYKGRQ